MPRRDLSDPSRQTSDPLSPLETQSPSPCHTDPGEVSFAVGLAENSLVASI